MQRPFFCFFYKISNSVLVLHSLNTTSPVIGRCLWNIRMQTYRWRHGEIFFLYFVQQVARFWKLLRDYFKLASKVLEKSLSRAVYKKKEKPDSKSILGNLKFAATGGNLLGCVLPCVCSVIAHRVTRYHKAATFTLSWLSYVPWAKLLVQSWSALLTFEPVNEIL